MEPEKVFEIVNTIKDDIEKGLNTHLGFIKDKLDIIIKTADKNEDDIQKIKDTVKDMGYRIETLEREQKESCSKIVKIEEFINQIKKEITQEIEKLAKLVGKRYSIRRIVTILLGILSTPIIMLLVQAWMKAKGWL